MVASIWQQAYGSKHMAASTWQQVYGEQDHRALGNKSGEEALQATASSNSLMAATVKLFDHNLARQEAEEGSQMVWLVRCIVNQ